MITLPIGLPNHPSYPSGHSCNSAAATTVLAHFFPAHTQDLASQLTEAGRSRMYGGIHYQFDIDAGADLGRAVARLAIEADRNDGLLSVLNSPVAFEPSAIVPEPGHARAREWQVQAPVARSLSEVYTSRSESRAGDRAGWL